MRGKRTVVQHRNKCLRSMQRSSVEETSHENALQPGHDCVEPLRECPTVARLEGGEELQEDLEGSPRLDLTRLEVEIRMG